MLITCRYCKPQHAFYDLAADVIAENPQYVAKHLSQDLQDYLQATIMRQVMQGQPMSAEVMCGVLHSDQAAGHD
jgi:hypothetical protein